MYGFNIPRKWIQTVCYISSLLNHCASTSVSDKCKVYWRKFSKHEIIRIRSCWSLLRIFWFGSPYRHRIQFTIYSELHKNDLKKKTELFTIAGSHSSSSNHKYCVCAFTKAKTSFQVKMMSVIFKHHCVICASVEILYRCP